MGVNGLKIKLACVQIHGPATIPSYKRAGVIAGRRWLQKARMRQLPVATHQVQHVDVVVGKDAHDLLLAHGAGVTVSREEGGGHKGCQSAKGRDPGMEAVPKLFQPHPLWST